MSDREKIELIEHYLIELGVRDLLQDPDTIEVRLNSDGRLFLIQVRGDKKLINANANQATAHMLMNALASWKDISFNDKNPLMSEELPTGERFSAQIPPVAPAPCFCLRKPPERIIALEEYLNRGQLQENHYQSILEAVKEKRSIMVLGSTGSGKTTFANAVLEKIAATGDRLVVIEDLIELKCEAEDVERLRTSRSISMQELVKQSLRLTPDRIIIGEVRDAAALDLLKAWNTGHPGGIATLHANGAADGISRLEQLILEAMPVVPDRLIEAAVDLFIYIENKGEKRHHITQMFEAVKTGNNWTYKSLD